MATDINGTALAVRDETTRDIASIDLTAIERVIVAGDLAKLSPDQRWDYYQGVCRSMGLNPFTKPFEYITLNGKLTLYALKGCTDQLRRVYGVSLTQPSIQFDGGLCIVTITGRDKTDRADTDIGAVNVEGLKGEARANAVMKAITKGKRRVTLSLCGLGMLDETEVETIPNAVRPGFDPLPSREAEAISPPACENCGAEIHPARFRDRLISAAELVERSRERYGQVLCIPCGRAEVARQAPPPVEVAEADDQDGEEDEL